MLPNNTENVQMRLSTFCRQGSEKKGAMNYWEWVTFGSLRMSCRSPGQNLPDGHIFLVRIWFSAEENILQTEFAFMKENK